MGCCCSGSMTSNYIDGIKYLYKILIYLFSLWILCCSSFYSTWFLSFLWKRRLRPLQLHYLRWKGIFEIFLWYQFCVSRCLEWHYSERIKISDFSLLRTTNLINVLWFEKRKIKVASFLLSFHFPRISERIIKVAFEFNECPYGLRWQDN